LQIGFLFDIDHDIIEVTHDLLGQRFHDAADDPAELGEGHGFIRDSIAE